MTDKKYELIKRKYDYIIRTLDEKDERKYELVKKNHSYIVYAYIENSSLKNEIGYFTTKWGAERFIKKCANQEPAKTIGYYNEKGELINE